MLTSIVVLSAMASTAMASAARGLLYMPDTSYPNDYKVFIDKNLGWYYNYDSVTSTVLDAAGMEFVPMLWGNKDGKAERFISDVTSLSKVPAYALGMNEPDVTTANGGSEMSPSDAADFYYTYVTALKKQIPGIKIGSPACSSAPTGTAWIISFMALCKAKGCDIDFVALHYYGQTDYLINTLLPQYTTAFPDTELWLTEWADANDSLDNTETAITGILSGLDSSAVVRHSYFGAVRESTCNIGVNAALLDNNGALKSIGTNYMSGGGVVSSYAASVVSSTSVSTPAAYTTAEAHAADYVVTSAASVSSTTTAAQVLYNTATSTRSSAASHPTTMSTIRKKTQKKTSSSTCTSTKTSSRIHRHHRHKHTSSSAAPSVTSTAEYIVQPNAYGVVVEETRYNTVTATIYN